MGTETRGANGALTRVDAAEIQRIEADAERVMLQRKIDASQQQIRSSVEQLGDRFKDGLDWRGWVRRHPLEAVGIAFGVGVLLGARRYL
jgi:ElaB/YqjD/DUF883 family membrane-anchored ribosome-binding protein